MYHTHWSVGITNVANLLAANPRMPLLRRQAILLLPQMEVPTRGIGVVSSYNDILDVELLRMDQKFDRHRHPPTFLQRSGWKDRLAGPAFIAFTNQLR